METRVAPVGKSEIGAALMAASEMLIFPVLEGFSPPDVDVAVAFGVFAELVCTTVSEPLDLVGRMPGAGEAVTTAPMARRPMSCTTRRVMIVELY